MCKQLSFPYACNPSTHGNRSLGYTRVRLQYDVCPNKVLITVTNPPILHFYTCASR